jgi:hypothetical protein
MLGLLPIEKFVPKNLRGPLLAFVSAASMFFDPARLRWWEWVLFPLGVVAGIWVSWDYYQTHRHLLPGADQNDE